VTDRISPQRFHESIGVDDWHVVAEGACAHFRTGSFADGARFVQAISELSGLAERHPDIDLRHRGVTVRLTTVDERYGGLTGHSVDLARSISAAARALGLASDPSAVQVVQLTVDALVGSAVMPFWRALLGYTGRADSPEDLIDPHGRAPSLWFQEMAVPRTGRNRVHLDVWLPPELAEGRVAAAVAAGGHVVTAANAPAWWVLADVEGNEACVATWAGRG
jgi:4a-hydroxytetrahydrobiopterin dehydratase